MRRSVPRRSRGHRDGLRPLAAAVAVGLAVTLGGCARGQQGADPDRPPLTVGASLSLTGDFADPGHAVQRGYDLWVDTVNAKGGLLGRRVRLKVLDDASDPDKGAANYERLIGTDHVDLVLGPFSTKITVTAAKVAARHGFAMPEAAGAAPAVFAQHLNNVFLVQPAPGVEQGAVFAQYLLSLPPAERPKTAAYLALDDPFTQPIADHVRTTFDAAGVQTLYAATYPEGANPAPFVARAAATRPDVLVAGTQTEDGYAVVNALVKRRWAPKWLYLSNGASSPVGFPAAVGRQNVNGIFSSGDWFPGSNANGSAVFVSAYLKKYRGAATDIDNTSVEAYCAGLLLEQVAAKTGKVDNATIIRSLHAGVWLTPVGDLSWDANGAPNGSLILFEWIDGELQAVYPPGRAQHDPAVIKLAWGTPAG
jgi:branched-chain amino acid transport system substrate-binding protein